VVRTPEKREVIVHVHPQTKFLLNDRAARFADLREGVEVTTLYDVSDARNLASSVTIAPMVEGTVVRVVEAEKQIVVRYRFSSLRNCVNVRVLATSLASSPARRAW
jgi:hypothetical protein